MKIHFKPIQNATKSNKQLRHSKKAWWDDDLGELWTNMHKHERIYLKTPRHNTNHKQARLNFLHAQPTFDKNVKKKKRKFLRNRVQEIETANTNDPVAFWNFINGLNPRKKAPSYGKPWIKMAMSQWTKMKC